MVHLAKLVFESANIQFIDLCLCSVLSSFRLNLRSLEYVYNFPIVKSLFAFDMVVGCMVFELHSLFYYNDILQISISVNIHPEAISETDNVRLIQNHLKLTFILSHTHRSEHPMALRSFDVSHSLNGALSILQK